MFTIAKSFLTAAAVGAALVDAYSYSLEIATPENAPVNASWPVPHDFASFSWPAHWFADYAGNKSSPNLFSRDILDLLYNKTGAHPFIRVGGSSTDRLWYNKSQEISSYVYYDPESPTYDYGIADEVRVNDVFFEGFDNFPGSHWSFQVNMGKGFNMTGGLENTLEASKIVMDIVQDKLESFELGNEPENMEAFFQRPRGYSMADYVEDWNLYASEVSEKVLKGNPYGLEEKRFFQAFTTSGMDEGWMASDGFPLGIDRNGFVKSISFHQYAAKNQPWVRLQGSYMNHTANRNNVTQWVPEVELSTNYEPGLPFVLGETNSNSYNLKMAQIEGVFGSALWLIDHLMMGMAVNMTRYNLIQGTTFGYSAWIPVYHEGREPYVRAPLYGQLFVADVLGHHHEVQVSEVMNLPWNMSAYGVYEAGSLAKYVVVNYDEWNSTTSYERPSQEVSLSIPSDIESVTVERLTGAGASADEGIQWAGMSWNYSDGRLLEQGTHQQETVEVSNGFANLTLLSTEAVLVHLKPKYDPGAGSFEDGEDSGPVVVSASSRSAIGAALSLALAILVMTIIL